MRKFYVAILASPLFVALTATAAHAGAYSRH